MGYTPYGQPKSLMARPNKIGGLEIVMRFTLLEGDREQAAGLFQSGEIAIARSEDEVELINLHEHVDRLVVETRGIVIHGGPTGCLGGLVAGLANLAMSSKGLAQGKFRVVLKAGGERRFRIDPDDLRALLKAVKGFPLKIDEA